MDVTSPEFLRNPYPFYAQRRSAGPVFQRSSHEWTLTGYHALNQFLAHPAAGRGNVGQAPRLNSDPSDFEQLRSCNPALQMLDRWMLFQNPPEHTQTRKSISAEFSAKVTQSLEPVIRARCKALVSEVEESGNQTFDFAKTLAFHFPLNVISDLIGIPPRDRTRFYAWTRSLSACVEVDFSTLHPQKRAELNQSAKDMEAYFQTQTQNKGERDPSSLMDTFIAGNESRMDTVQLLANCAFLLFAGQETTTSLLSNAMAALLEHPDQLELLRRRPELIENAVEECLRYDPSIQMVGRHALDDIQLGEHLIEKGSHIFAFIGAAGRDPAVCDEPDRFEVDRDPIKHLAFARGTHHCLGALLARLEIKIMLEELLESFAVLEQAGPAQRRPTWLMRGFDSLPLRYGHD